MDTNDSAELEALFDSIATAQESMPEPAPVVSAAPEIGDSDDLQALFDSVASETVTTASAATPVAASGPEGDAEGNWDGQEGVYKKIGKMARELHDALRQMGYDKMLESTMSAIPDARDRLAYVANLTEQAACRVLNATDVAQPVVDRMKGDSEALAARWDAMFNNQLSVGEFKQLAEETRGFLKGGLPGMADQTSAQLMEIMMAQDFQDLTGQVIKKIVSLAQSLEDGLMHVLLEVMPERCKQSEEVSSLLNGPVVTAEGRTDVVVNQQQVDDLLETLGF